MDAKLLEEIYPKIITTDDVNRLHQKIDELIDVLYSKGMNIFFDNLENQTEAWLSSLVKSKKLVTEADIDKFLRDIQKEIRRLKTVKLSIAIEPTEKLIEDIGKWIDVELGNKIIVELDIDKTLLGGAVVSINGQYTSLTLGKKIDSIFERYNNEIIKQLSNDNSTLNIKQNTN